MLWAVHIADGVLSMPWLVGGFGLAVVLAVVGVAANSIVNCSRGTAFREEEIAKVALLTAAFFVASLVHVRVGPTSVHLLLNGLVGVILGWWAALAIPVGLFLQAALLQHGGFTTLGVNSCVMVLPALLAWVLFNGLRRLPFVCRPWFRAALVVTSTLVWTLSVVFSIALLSSNQLGHLEALDPTWAEAVTLHPATLAVALLLAVMAARLERRLGNAPEFPLGLLVGEVAVLATTLLNCLVLLWGGDEDWHTLALVTFVAHLPIAVIEGTVLGFVVGFVARVKPELLGWTDLTADAHAPAISDGLASQTTEPLNGRTVHAPALNLAAPPCPALEPAGDAGSVRARESAPS
jgi:cobalt/nickel transport system permease protein